MTTPLYPTFCKRIDDTVDQLIQNQVTPWSFLTAGPPFRIKKFDGKEIAYQGIGFEGSEYRKNNRSLRRVQMGSDSSYQSFLAGRPSFGEVANA